MNTQKELEKYWITHPNLRLYLETFAFSIYAQNFRERKIESEARRGYQC